MALNFPSNPTDGQIYPDPPVPGAQQYIYNANKGTWLTVFKGIESISARSPIFIKGPRSTPIVEMDAATDSADGYMTAADKSKLDSLPTDPGTVKSVTAGVGLGAPITGDTITTSGTINLLPPTPLAIGGVKPGIGMEATPEGTLNLKPPGSLAIGGVKQGNGVNISSDGTISIKPSGTFTVLDSLSGVFNGVSTSFTLTSNSAPFAPSSPNSLLIFIGGVAQTPNIAFSINGTIINFSSAPPLGASFYGISLT